MIEPYLLAFWGVWLFVILIAAFRVFGFPIARRLQDRRWKIGVTAQQPVALIVPVKGFDLHSTPRFFDAIFGQSYGDYRVIVCFESWSDPVARWLCEHLELNDRRRIWNHPDPTSGLRSITLVCGGIAEAEGQKVQNQRAAFRDLGPRDAIIAFADSDILCGTDWLARLVAPINHATHELSTTYRWLVPKNPTLPNQLACIINASITTQGGAEWSTVLWGGSMALTRRLFDELDVPELLAGSLNDDLRLSKAARATGRKIAFVRSLILPTTIDFTWGSFFEFVRRQYTQVKFFSPILYTGVNFVLAFYVLGVTTILAALVYGYFYAWVPVAAAYVIDQFRALARQQVYLSLFKDQGIRQKLFAAGWLEHMITPLWMTLHWILLASTWTQSRLTWAGVRYQILSKSKTRVIHRSATATPLPIGAPGLAMLSALNDRRRTIVPRTITPLEAIAAPIAPARPSSFSERIELDAVASSEATTVSASDQGDSAVLPLTVSFHERPGGVRFRASDRGTLGAADFLLGKTRVRPHRLHPSPLPVTEVIPAASPTRSRLMITTDTKRGRVVTALERGLDKTRLRQAGERRFPTATSSLSRPLPPARIDRARTRVRPALLVAPIAAAGEPSPAPVSNRAASRNSAPRSPGGRRTFLGSNLAAFAPGRGVAVRSLRPLSSGRTGCHPIARPIQRGASARP